MITQLKNVYKCEHCKKNGLSKHKMVQHENQCTKNPINFHPCFTCINFDVTEESHEEHYEGGGNDLTRWIKSEYWECKKHKICLHTRRAEVKGLINKYPESFIDTELMPSECEFYSKKNNETDFVDIF